MLNAMIATAMLSATAPSSVELTVYNQGFALVKESRKIDLRAGLQDVRIEDVASQIEPTSVAIRSTSAPGSFTVLEQNYQFDLISTQAILAKAVGQSVTLIRSLGNGQSETIVGILLAAPSNVLPAQGGAMYTGMVIRTQAGKILMNPIGEISIDSIPEGLISKPTLLWQLEATGAGLNTVELSYLTQGIRWESSYVLALDREGGIGDFKGWVTLNNQSGANYANAKLKLLAGDVQRAEAPKAVAARMAAADSAGSAGFAQEAFADYHLYTLQRPATVRNNEIKQVSLLEAFRVPVTRRLIVDPMAGFQGWQPQEGEVGTGPIKPVIRIEIVNDEKSKLGMPLPMGTVKVFQRDSSGSLQMLGEDRIEHTPKNEKFRLDVGRAFDVVVERKRTAYTPIRNSRGEVRGATETFQIQVRNRKDSADTVTVIERYWGDFRVTNQSLPFTKLDANTLQFEVPVKAQEAKTLEVTVETRW